MNVEVKLHDITSSLSSSSSSSDLGTWIGLLEKLYNNGIVKENDVSKYKKREHGGGCPGKVFLDKLKFEQSETTIEDLKEKAIKYNRYDIKTFLESIGNLTLLTELNITQRSQLGDKLNENLNGNIYNWEAFADSYGYDYDAKNGIKAHQQIPDEWYSAKGVLQDVVQQHRNYPLSSLAVILGEMGRNDVKNKVEEFIKDAAKRPRENHNKKASQSPTHVQEDNGSQSSNDRKASNLSLDNNVYSHIGCNVLIAAAVVVAVLAIFFQL